MEDVRTNERTKRVLFMGAVKSRADKTTRADGRTDTEMLRVTLTQLANCTFPLHEYYRLLMSYAEGGQNMNSNCYSPNAALQFVTLHRDAKSDTALTLLQMTDRPKAGKRSEKTSKISQCGTQPQFPLGRTRGSPHSFPRS